MSEHKGRGRPQHYQSKAEKQAAYRIRAEGRRQEEAAAAARREEIRKQQVESEFSRILNTLLTLSLSNDVKLDATTRDGMRELMKIVSLHKSELLPEYRHAIEAQHQQQREVRSGRVYDAQYTQPLQVNETQAEYRNKTEDETQAR